MKNYMENPFSNSLHGSVNDSTKHWILEMDKVNKTDGKNTKSNNDNNKEDHGRITTVTNVSKSKSQGISNPHPHDILCGRGNAVNRHDGNIFFRKIISRRKTEYRMGAYPFQRRKVSCKVLEEIKNLNPPGRFLMLKGSEWFECDESKAICKISQALRELASNDPVDVHTLQNKSSSALLSNIRIEDANSSTTLMSSSIPSLSSASNSASGFRLNNSYILSTNELRLTSQTTDNICFEGNVAKSSSSVQADVALSNLNHEYPEASEQNSLLSNENGCPKFNNNHKLHLKKVKKSLPHKSGYGDEDVSWELMETTDNQQNKLPKKRLPAKHLSQNNSKAQKILPDDHQLVIMPLSYIGRSFATCVCSDDSKDIFKQIANLDQREDALLYLPSILGSLCKRVIDLENEVR